MHQEGDVLLFQSTDGGEIEAVNGLLTMSGGLETMAYLCLFGGNENDSAGADSARQWWGNLTETDPALQYRSETQNLLQALPATSNNLKRVEQAAKRDLQVFITSGIATEVNVSVTIPAINSLKITGNIAAYGETSEFEFTENWKSIL